jgi:hypothetical protein
LCFAGERGGEEIAACSTGAVELVLDIPAVGTLDPNGHCSPLFVCACEHAGIIAQHPNTPTAFHTWKASLWAENYISRPKIEFILSAHVI